MSHADFWSQMRESPEDDFAHHVYADFLDELADGRGEVLRIAAHLASLSPLDADVPDLVFHENELLNQEAGEWLAAAPHWVDDILFHRAMLLPRLSWSQIADDVDLFGVVPVIGVRLPNRFAQDVAKDVRPLAKEAGLSALRFLSGVKRAEATGLDKLFGSPHLSGLWSLAGDGNLCSILKWGKKPLLPGLRRLVLADGRLRMAGSDYRIAPKLLSGLHILELHGEAVGEYILKRVLTADGPLALHTLRCENLPKAAIDFAPLFDDGGPVPHLRHLTLSGQAVKTSEWHAFAQSGFAQRVESLGVTLSLRQADPFPREIDAPHLTRLTLDDCRLSTEHWIALLNCGLLENVETLSIRFRERTQPTWERVFNNFPLLPRLTSLHVRGAELDAEAMSGFQVAAERMPNLRRLSLGIVDRSGLDRLLRTDIPTLQDLHLRDSVSYFDSNLSIVDRTLLSGLRGLDLVGSDTGHVYLTDALLASGPTKLERLRVYGPNGNPEGIKPALKERMMRSPLRKSLKLLRTRLDSTGEGEVKSRFVKMFRDQLASGVPVLSTSDPDWDVDWAGGW